MEQRIVIVYNPLTQTVGVVENEFTTFEAFGILEAVKMLITADWIKKTEE